MYKLSMNSTALIFFENTDWYVHLETSIQINRSQINILNHYGYWRIFLHIPNIKISNTHIQTCWITKFCDTEFDLQKNQMHLLLQHLITRIDDCWIKLQKHMKWHSTTTSIPGSPCEICMPKQLHWDRKFIWQAELLAFRPQMPFLHWNFIHWIYTTIFSGFFHQSKNDIFAV